MEISTDKAKLALDVVGDSKTVKKLGQTRTVEKRLQNVCIQIQAGNIGVLDFFNSYKSKYKKKVYLIITLHY